VCVTLQEEIQVLSVSVVAYALHCVSSVCAPWGTVQCESSTSVCRVRKYGLLFECVIHAYEVETGETAA